MPSAPPDVSIIIVSWNTRDVTLNCLAALPAAIGDVSVEVWLVDNGSTDGSVEAARAQYPHIHFILNTHNAGFAAANNQAIPTSAGRHILLLNSDAIAQPGAIAALVRFIDAQPRVGIVGAQLLNRDGTLQESWAAFPTVWSEVRGKNIRARRPYDGTPAYSVDWVGGACLLIRREAVDRIGLMDTSYFMYSEETDWCYRVKQAGWDVCYLPTARVIHLGGQSSRQASLRMKIELQRSKLAFFHKHYGDARMRRLRLALSVAFRLKAIAGRWLDLATPGRSMRWRTLSQDWRALARSVREYPEATR